jgi:hypothetical protein
MSECPRGTQNCVTQLFLTFFPHSSLFLLHPYYDHAPGARLHWAHRTRLQQLLLLLSSSSHLKLSSAGTGQVNSPLNPAMKDERDQDFRSDIERQRQRLRLIKLLREIIEFPPQHIRHEHFLPQFHGVASFDKSVFVMTKFPDPKKLSSVDTRGLFPYEAVQQVRRQRLESRVAVLVVVPGCHELKVFIV